MIINFDKAFKELILQNKKLHTIRSSRSVFLGDDMELAVEDEVFARAKVDFVMYVNVLHYADSAYIDVPASDMKRYYAQYSRKSKIWQNDGFATEEEFKQYFLKKTPGEYVLIGWVLLK